MNRLERTILFSFAFIKADCIEYIFDCTYISVSCVYNAYHAKHFTSFPQIGEYKYCIY